MGEIRKYKKVKRKKSTLRDEWRYLIVITLVCLVLAFAVALMTGKAPYFLDRTIQKHVERNFAENINTADKKMLEKIKKENLEDIVKKYKETAKSYK